MSTEPFSTQHLDYLQRTSLDLAALSATSPLTSASPDLRRLWCVRGVGCIEKRLPLSRGERVRLASEDALVGLYGKKIPLAFLVSSTPGGVAIHLGTWPLPNGERVSAETPDDRQGVLRAMLNTLYPAIELDGAEVELNRFLKSGLALGIPTAKSPDPSDGALALDRLIRALSGTNWACLVVAAPVAEDVTSKQRNITLSEMRTVQAAVQAGGTPSPLAAHYSELLTVALKALTRGLEAGLWRTGVYLLGDRQSYDQLASVWRGIFSGDDSLPEPVRVWESVEAGQLAVRWALPDTPGGPGPGHYSHLLRYQTLLTSNQLAAYVHLPQLETNGFAITTVPDFDAVPPSSRDDKVLRLGTVLLRSRPTETAYTIGLKDLKRHVFVGGVTGAGKTNTIFYLLKQAAALQVPFLVLEPAKTEYRALLDDPNLHGRLQVFTLGNELTAPFRLNPFEVVGWPKVPVGVHLDLLRSVFSASFGMWTPLPQILEQCLYAVYRDRGWDITTNTNHRRDSKSDVADAFPTLAELTAKADEILAQLGYEGRIVDDMRAALLTRLNGLRAGGKGSMLDVQRSLPMDALLDHPTVLELQGMGDDDDKAFVMGLLLIRLYEYRRAGNEVDHLQHLMVIEEAHRLLTNVGARRSEEEADPRAKAVETFATLLSEIRAYGQGVIVVDQIPVKLAPEVMKNTNLKVAHRTVAADDRTALAETMVMDERQARALATLIPGQAAVFSEGDDSPVVVKVPPAKDPQGQNPPDDKRVQEYMSSSEIHVDMYQPAACRARDVVRTLVDTPSFRRDFVRLVVSITEDDGALDRLWNDLIVRAQADRQADMDEEVLLRSLVVYASAWFAHRRGSQAGWSYSDTAELEDKLRSVLLAKLESKNALQALKLFRAVMYRLHARPFEPFPGCAKICTQSPPVCLYRLAVEDFMAWTKDDLAGEWNRALNIQALDQRLQQAWEAAGRASFELIEYHFVQLGASRRISLCYSQHRLSALFAEQHEKFLGGLLADTRAAGAGG